MSVHVLVGLLFLVIALMGVSEVLGGARRMLLPGTTVGGAAVLLAGIVATEFTHEGLPMMVTTPHRLIALTLIAAGAVQALGRRFDVRSLELVAAFSWAVVGAMFALHQGGSPQDAILHGIIAAALLLSGLVQLSVLLANEEIRTMQLLAYLLIVVAGLGLFFYDPTLAGGATHDH